MPAVSRGRLWSGLILVTLGVLFLLDQAGVIRFGEFLGTWWPSILILVGLQQIRSGWPPRRSGGVILVLLGVFFQISNLDLFPWWSAGRLWPLVLIALGLWLLTSRARRQKAPADVGTRSDNGEVVDAFAMFSGLERTCTSQQFRGGDASTIFGGIELDLRQAALAPGEQRLNLTAVFGGIAVRVPDTWQVVVEGSPLFGHIGDGRRTAGTPATPQTAPGGPSLHVHGTAIFGGIELKS